MVAASPESESGIYSGVALASKIVITSDRIISFSRKCWCPPCSHDITLALLLFPTRSSASVQSHHNITYSPEDLIFIYLTTRLHAG